jgi:hypothetical protein
MRILTALGISLVQSRPVLPKLALTRLITKFGFASIAVIVTFWAWERAFVSHTGLIGGLGNP